MKATINSNFGIKNCADCENNIRCEECVYNKKHLEEVLKEARKGTAREILTLIKNGVELNSMIDGDAKIAIMNELRWAGQKYGVDFTNS